MYNSKTTLIPMVLIQIYIKTSHYTGFSEKIFNTHFKTAEVRENVHTCKYNVILQDLSTLQYLSNELLFFERCSLITAISETLH